MIADEIIGRSQAGENASYQLSRLAERVELVSSEHEQD